MPALSLPVGTRINDRYEVVGYLGSGLNGQVYEVADENLATRVALKLLQPRAGQPLTWDEAQVLEQLRSNYLLPVLNADLVVNSDIRFITTPIAAGGDLLNVATPHGCSVDDAIKWGRQTAIALHRVHTAGLVHRDVKPSNIYIDSEENALLGDFGMAVRLGPEGTATPDGALMTRAPETLTSPGQCSVASDVYSLGATVFYLLSGQYPVDSEAGEDGIRLLTIEGKRRRLASVAPYVSRSVAMVIERALATEVGRRQATAWIFANKLAAARPLPRRWQKVEPHTDYVLCYDGGPVAGRQAVHVCVAVDKGKKLGTAEVRLKASGARVRRHEIADIPLSRLQQSLQKLLADV